MGLGPVLDELLAAWFARDPLEATRAGVPGYDHLLGAFERDADVEWAATLRSFRARLDSWVPPTVADAVDRDHVVAFIDGELIDHDVLCIGERLPERYVLRPLLGLLQLLAAGDLATEQRTDAILGRLGAIPAAIDAGRSRLASATPPALAVQRAQQIAATAGAFLDDVRNGVAPGASPGLLLDLDRATTAARSALAEFGALLVDTVRPRATGRAGIGTAAYDALLSRRHRLPWDAAALCALGEAALADRRTERAGAARELAADTPEAELLARLRADTPRADQRVVLFRQAIERARTFVLDRALVTLPAGERLALIETPPFLRSMIPLAAYWPPRLQAGDRTGRMFITSSAGAAEAGAAREAPGTADRHVIPVMALHETYPGHHVQFVRAGTNPRPARRYFVDPTLSEGWAVYCEDMMFEQGFFADPRERLMQLDAGVLRACRLLVDASLHTGRLSPNECVALLSKEACLQPQRAEGEVAQAACRPGLLMGYTVGRHFLRELRAARERREGAAFRLCAFHDAVLAAGPLPVPLVARCLDSP